MTEFYEEDTSYAVETEIPQEVAEALITLSEYLESRGDGRSYLLCVPHEEDISYHKLIVTYAGVSKYAPIPTEELN